jgi:hypothetical protein
MKWEFYEKRGFWVVHNIETEEKFIVLTRMCAIELSARLNEYEMKLDMKLSSYM